MLTTLFYSLLALDQTLADAGRAVRALDLRHPVPRDLRRDRAWSSSRSCPATRMLFIAGTVVAAAGLNVHVLVVVADRRGRSSAIRVNYAVGHYIGPRVIRSARFALVQAGAPATARRRSTTGTAASRSSSAASCRSSAPSRRSSPASAAMTYRRFLSFNVIGAVAVDRRRSSTRATSSATSPGSRTTCR